MSRSIPALIHVRTLRRGTPSTPPPASSASSATGSTLASGPESASDDATRAMPLDAVRRELQSGALPRDTEVLFAGLGDWTPADAIPELWITPPPPQQPSSDDPAADSGGESVRSVPISHVERPRRGFSALGIAGAVGGAIVLLGLGAVAIFFIYFYYKPVAIRHLPNKCTIAARVDLLDWAFFDPFSKRVMPAIDEAQKPKVPPTTPAGPSLKERMLASAGINLDRDVREIAVCMFEDKRPSSAATGSTPVGNVGVVIAIGGKLKSGQIAGIYEALRSESWASGLRLDGTGDRAVIRVPAPMPGVIGQAEDGTIVFAPDDQMFASLRDQTPENEAKEATGLRLEGGFEINAQHTVFALLGMAIKPSPALDADTLDALAKVKSGYFGLTLGKAPRIDLHLEDKNDVDARDTEKALHALLDLAKTGLAAEGSDHAGEHAAISGATLQRDDIHVDLRLDFPYGDVDRGATELADAIKDPASNLRKAVLPSALFSLGLGPAPPAAPSASTSASTSSSVPPHGSSSVAPPPKPDFDE